MICGVWVPQFSPTAACAGGNHSPPRGSTPGGHACGSRGQEPPWAMGTWDQENAANWGLSPPKAHKAGGLQWCPPPSQHWGQHRSGLIPGCPHTGDHGTPSLLSPWAQAEVGGDKSQPQAARQGHWWHGDEGTLVLVTACVQMLELSRCKSPNPRAPQHCPAGPSTHPKHPQHPALGSPGTTMGHEHPLLVGKWGQGCAVPNLGALAPPKHHWGIRLMHFRQPQCKTITYQAQEEEEEEGRALTVDAYGLHWSQIGGTGLGGSNPIPGTKPPHPSPPPLPLSALPLPFPSHIN